MEETYKVISIISSNVVAWVEEYPTISMAQQRLKEIEETNDDCLETTGNAFVVKGEIVAHNFKNLDKIQLS